MHAMFATDAPRVRQTPENGRRPRGDKKKNRAPCARRHFGIKNFSKLTRGGAAIDLVPKGVPLARHVRGDLAQGSRRALSGVPWRTSRARARTVSGHRTKGRAKKVWSDACPEVYAQVAESVPVLPNIDRCLTGDGRRWSRLAR